jgi:hypothetical protein
VVTPEGHTVDYTPAQMGVFCSERDLAVVPTLWAGPHSEFDAGDWLERRYYDEWVKRQDSGVEWAIPFIQRPVPLSDRKTVDEGVCIRYDGPFGPYVLKAKSPTFLVFESKALDTGAEDLEAAEDAENEVEAA